MKKQHTILSIPRCLMVLIMMLCALSALSGGAGLATPIELPETDVLIMSPHLKADMLRVLEQYSNNSNGLQVASSRLKQYFLKEKVVLPPSEIQQAVKILNLYHESEISKPSRGVRMNRLLIAFGEPASITNTINSLSSDTASGFTRARSDLVRSEQPRLIVALGDLLFGDDSITPKVRGGDFLVYPLSIETAQIIIDLLSVCEQFPAPVRVWAQKETGSTDPKTRRWLVRQWWTQNKKALQEERFHDTVPPKPAND